MPAHDPQGARPDHARGLYVLLLAQPEHPGADDPGRIEPRDQADHDRERDHALVEDSVQGDEPVADRRPDRDQQEEHRKRSIVNSVTRETAESVQPPK
jgi:hypothetical protein